MPIYGGRGKQARKHRGGLRICGRRKRNHTHAHMMRARGGGACTHRHAHLDFKETLIVGADPLQPPLQQGQDLGRGGGGGGQCMAYWHIGMP